MEFTDSYDLKVTTAALGEVMCSGQEDILAVRATSFLPNGAGSDRGESNVEYAFEVVCVLLLLETLRRSSVAVPAAQEEDDDADETDAPLTSPFAHTGSVMQSLGDAGAHLSGMAGFGAVSSGADRMTLSTDGGGSPDVARRYFVRSLLVLFSRIASMATLIFVVLPPECLRLVPPS